MKRSRKVTNCWRKASCSPHTIPLTGKLAFSKFKQYHGGRQKQLVGGVEARERRNQDEIHEEFGDLLFVMVNVARHLKIDPEAALRDTNAKFTRRFRAIESALADMGQSPVESDLATMDALWDQAKAAEKGATK